MTAKDRKFIVNHKEHGYFTGFEWDAEGAISRFKYTPFVPDALMMDEQTAKNWVYGFNGNTGKVIFEMVRVDHLIDPAKN